MLSSLQSSVINGMNPSIIFFYLYILFVTHTCTLHRLLKQLIASYVFYDLINIISPQLNSLLGTKVEWLYYILQAFNTGDLVRYQELCHVHKDALNAQPALVANERKLLEKINILCLMEIIFRYAVVFYYSLTMFSFKKLSIKVLQFEYDSLIDMFSYCSRPAEDRTIPLNVIAERTKLSTEDVEYLLMKSLSVSCLIMFPT